MNAQQINTIRLYAKQNPIMWGYLYDRMLKKVKYEVLDGTPPPTYKEALKIKIKHYKFKEQLTHYIKDLYNITFTNDRGTFPVYTQRVLDREIGYLLLDRMMNSNVYEEEERTIYKTKPNYIIDNTNIMLRKRFNDHKKRVEKENSDNINKKLEEQFNKMKEKLEEENSNNFICCNICFEDKDPFYMVKCKNNQHNIGCLDCAGRHIHSKTYGHTKNVSCPYCREGVICEAPTYYPKNRYCRYNVDIDKERYNNAEKKWIKIRTEKDRSITFTDYEELDGGKYKLSFRKNFNSIRNQRQRKDMSIKISSNDFDKFRDEDFKRKIYINKFEEEGIKYRCSFTINICFDKLTDKEYYKNKPNIDLERIKKYCSLNANEWVNFDKYHLSYNR